MEELIDDMEKELPKIDLPTDWLVGTGITKELLELYTDFPCCIKSEIFVLCTNGEVEASVNLNRVKVKANDFVTILPGTIIQIHSVTGDIELYIGGFSSKYLEQAALHSDNLKGFYVTMRRSLISLKPQSAEIIKDYFCLLIKVYEYCSETVKRAMASNLYNDIHAAIEIMYSKNATDVKPNLSRSEIICKNFTQLVTQHYKETRNVAWYAEKMNITHAHLCTTVKQSTGNTCIEIISRMVIMDAKSQLKSTNLSIQEIADSLNFANMSFFGKYFKRYVGMSPLEYRNKG